MAWWSLANRADAESLYLLDELDMPQRQARGYVDAASRLAEIQEEGRQRIEAVIISLRRSGSANELNYWKMDYIGQRAWMVKAQARICIDMIHRHERLLAECETAIQARRLLIQSDFFQGINALTRMQRKLAFSAVSSPIEDDLLAITLLCMAGSETTLNTLNWNRKRRDLIARLRAMRSELVYLAKNLDKIDIDGEDRF